jgi:hypothetical protein
MAATESSLITQAETIRDETGFRANTALRVGTYMRELLTWLRTFFVSYKVVDLSTNGTALNADGVIKVYALGTYTANTTLTLSNFANLKEVAIGLTNTNANVLTIAGITVSFKASQLPTGVTFATNALTFPADSAVLYNITLIDFHASGTFYGFIELAVEV